jgi:hypothetical protein
MATEDIVKTTEEEELYDGFSKEENLLYEDRICEYLRCYCVEDLHDYYVETTDGKWSLADLFIRQYLNNGGDGFGMWNVAEVYRNLCEHKDLLIEENLVSKDAWNNSGYPLWKDYNFDEYYRLQKVIFNQKLFKFREYIRINQNILSNPI